VSSQGTGREKWEKIFVGKNTYTANDIDERIRESARYRGKVINGGGTLKLGRGGKEGIAGKGKGRGLIGKWC